MEYICEKCNGTGRIYEGKPMKKNEQGLISQGLYISYDCDFCNGKSKLDWIENILGVDCRFINYRSREENDRLIVRAKL